MKIMDFEDVTSLTSQGYKQEDLRKTHLKGTLLWFMPVGSKPHDKVLLLKGRFMTFNSSSPFGVEIEKVVKASFKTRVKDILYRALLGFLPLLVLAQFFMLGLKWFFRSLSWGLVSFPSILFGLLLSVAFIFASKRGR